MISQNVSIAVEGSQMAAYLARPEEGSGPHPAVIVLQEIFGLTPETKRVTALLPTIGYVGLAINYFHRAYPEMCEPYTQEGNRNAFAAAAQITTQQIITDVRAAAAWLNTQPFVKSGKIATWGFGFGGTAAFISSFLTELRGAICFYPINLTAPLPSGGEPPLDHVREVAIPLLLVFGEQDYYVSRHDMDLIYRALKDAGKEFEMQIYPDVGHSFFRPGRPEAVAEQMRYSDEAVAHAVADSWNLVQRFLRDVFTRAPVSAAATGDIRTERTVSGPR